MLQLRTEPSSKVKWFPLSIFGLNQGAVYDPWCLRPSGQESHDGGGHRVIVQFLKRMPSDVSLSWDILLGALALVKLDFMPRL